MKYSLRAFVPDAQAYQTIASVERAIWQERSRDAGTMQSHDRLRAPEAIFQRNVAEVADNVVGFVEYGDAASHSEGRCFFLHLLVSPIWQGQGIGRALYDDMLLDLSRRKVPVRLLSTRVREDWPRGIRFLTDRGFRPVMRWIVSFLDVQSFPPTMLEESLAPLAGTNVQIASLSAWQRCEPAWQRKLYDLDWALTLDEPRPDQPTRPSFSTYVRRHLSGAGFHAKDWFVAVDGGRCVGMTSVICLTYDRRWLNSGFTGVLRTHRRLGIARALKATAINHARKRGYQRLRAMNEENNPMWLLNQQLGFESMTAVLAYEKQV